MTTLLAFVHLRRLGRGSPVARRLRRPEIEGLEDRTLLSPFPPSIQSNLSAYLSPDAVVSGFPTSVTPGETIHFSVTIAAAGVDDTYDPFFGYPYLVISYAEQNSVLINGQQPDAPDGAIPVYYFPYDPGTQGAPPDEPDPTVPSDDEQAVTLQGSNGDPYTGTVQITATIAGDAPGGTVTLTPSTFPNTMNAPGPWMFIVGEFAVNGDTTDLDTWSTAMPFVVASDVPAFSTAASSFFSATSPTGTVGAALAPSVVVDVDAGNAINTSYTGNVTITLSGGASGASLVNSSGTAVSSVTVPAVNGVATFSGANAIIINKAGAGYTLTATLADGTPNPSPSFNVQGHTLKFSAQPANSTAGDAMPVQVEVDTGGSIDNKFTGTVQLQLADASGNPITTAGVNFEDAQGSSLGTTLTTTASGGTADFSKILYIDKPGTYTLVASIPNDSSTPSMQSSSFTLGVHTVKITLPSPMGGGPNEKLPAVQVTVLNAQGNADPDYNSDVNLTLGGGLASGQNNSATLSGGQVAVTAGTGIASFANLMISLTGQSYYLTATLPPDAAPRDISAKFSIGDTLKFITQPPASPLAAVPGEPLALPRRTAPRSTRLRFRSLTRPGNLTRSSAAVSRSRSGPIRLAHRFPETWPRSPPAPPSPLSPSSASTPSATDTRSSPACPAIQPHLQ